MYRALLALLLAGGVGGALKISCPPWIPAELGEGLTGVPFELLYCRRTPKVGVLSRREL